MTQAREFELRNQGEEGTWKPIRFLADYSNINLSTTPEAFVNLI